MSAPLLALRNHFKYILKKQSFALQFPFYYNCCYIVLGMGKGRKNGSWPMEDKTAIQERSIN